MEQNAFENVIRKMAAILSRPQSVNTNNSNFQHYWWNFSMYVVHIKFNRGPLTFCWIMYEALFTVAIDDDSLTMVLSRLTVFKLSEIPFTWP